MRNQPVRSDDPNVPNTLICNYALAGSDAGNCSRCQRRAPTLTRGLCTICAIASGVNFMDTCPNGRCSHRNK